MTILNSGTIEILRMKKKKICGEFRNTFDLLATYEYSDVRLINDKYQIEMNNHFDVMEGDRCIADRRVFDIKSVVFMNGLSRERTVINCVINDFETSYQSLKDHGGDVSEGISVATGKDTEAEAFMDSWVGTFIVNIVSHYDEIKKGRDISPFYGMFNHDIPVACVGAGPSLDKNVHLLYDFPGVIISTDRAYKMLRARGIEPDLTFSVDCHYDHIVDMLDCPGTDKNKLVLNTCADPKITKIWGGDIFWFLMKHPGVQFMDKILPALFPKFHALPSLGNVGNGSAFFADYIGLSPVILVGHDYGYTNGRMHAQRFDIGKDGSISEIDDNHEELLQKRSGKVKSGDVVTYAPFFSYRDTMYDLREKRGMDIVNCTEGGILNKLPCLTLKSMIDILTPKYGKTYLDAKEKIQKI